MGQQASIEKSNELDKKLVTKKMLYSIRCNCSGILTADTAVKIQKAQWEISLTTLYSDIQRIYRYTDIPSLFYPKHRFLLKEHPVDYIFFLNFE